MYSSLRCRGGTLGGSSTTLGGCCGGGDGTLGDVAAVVVSDGLCVLKMASSFRMASLIGVPCSRNGLAGCGLLSAWARSSIAAAARSADDVLGISNLVGKKSTVSEPRHSLVDVTYTL